MLCVGRRQACLGCQPLDFPAFEDIVRQQSAATPVDQALVRDRSRRPGQDNAATSPAWNGRAASGVAQFGHGSVAHTLSIRRSHYDGLMAQITSSWNSADSPKPAPEQDRARVASIASGDGPFSAEEQALARRLIELEQRVAELERNAS